MSDVSTTDAVLVLALWVGLAILVAALADRRGRGIVGWVLCALLLSSLVALVLLAVLPDTRRKCPLCWLPVPDRATVCGHCARDIGAGPVRHQAFGAEPSPYNFGERRWP